MRGLGGVPTQTIHPLEQGRQAVRPVHRAHIRQGLLGGHPGGGDIERALAAPAEVRQGVTLKKPPLGHAHHRQARGLVKPRTQAGPPVEPSVAIDDDHPRGLGQCVEQGEQAQIRDELGDYLFQAVFYAQIAAERGDFDFDDVTHGIVAKLLRRHPHVFPAGTLESRRLSSRTPATAAIRERWESIKDSDRRERKLDGLLDDVPAALPALQRAEKLQRRAAGGGFDWADSSGVIAKLEEELGELREAMRHGGAMEREEELGDLLFCCVNLARHLGVNAEIALRGANNKFERRFRAIESELEQRGQRVQDCDPQTLDKLWEEAKASTRGG